MVNSREKGKRGELLWRDFLREHGHEARRGQQFSGSNGDPDVVSDMPGIHFEVKFVESLNVRKALNQAISDAREGEIPIVAHKRSREPWVVTMRAKDFITLYDRKRGVKDGI